MYIVLGYGLGESFSSKKINIKTCVDSTPPPIKTKVNLQNSSGYL